MPGRKSSRVMGPGGWDCGLGVLRWGGQGSLLEEVAFELTSYDGNSQPGEDWRLGGTLDQGSKAQGFERRTLVLFQVHKVGVA